MPDAPLLELKPLAAPLGELGGFENDLSALEQKKRDLLANAARIMTEVAEAVKHIEAVWMNGVRLVSLGQTDTVHANRAKFLAELAARLGHLKRAHAVMAQGRELIGGDYPDPDVLLDDIVPLEKLQRRLAEKWHTPEDLEDLAVEYYPLTADDLNRIGPTRRPPQSWYEQRPLNHHERLSEESWH